jgi:hypothetical protein
MIHDMDIPYGGPENWEQHELENERYLVSLNALARFHQLISEKGMHINDLLLLQHMRYECGINAKQLDHFLLKKEAA